MDKIKAGRLRFRRLAIAAVVIVAGLTLRLTGYDIGLPYLLVKYGGSTLWGMMVFWLLAALLIRHDIGRVAIASGIIAILVELSRLYHTPWLDEFRLTLAGALLLGRIFSLWNIIAYLVGIAIAWRIERHVKA